MYRKQTETQDTSVKTETKTKGCNTQTKHRRWNVLEVTEELAEILLLYNIEINAMKKIKTWKVFILIALSFTGADWLYNMQTHY